MLPRDPRRLPSLPLPDFYRTIAGLSAAVVTVSESVRRELVAHVPALRPVVIRTGIDEVDRSLDETRRWVREIQKDLGLPHPFRAYAARPDANAAALVLIDPPADAQGAQPGWIVPASPGLARIGVLRAGRLLSSKADGLPGSAALHAFLNRPDHLSRAAAELNGWNDAMTRAAGAQPAAGVRVVVVDAGTRDRIALHRYAVDVQPNARTLPGRKHLNLARAAPERVVKDVLGERELLAAGLVFRRRDRLAVRSDDFDASKASEYVPVSPIVGTVNMKGGRDVDGASLPLPALAALMCSSSTIPTLTWLSGKGRFMPLMSGVMTRWSRWACRASTARSCGSSRLRCCCRGRA